MSPIRVAIAEDHQSIVDGYLYRLKGSGVRVVGMARYGEQIEPLLAEHPADVLILDVHLPTSATDSTPFPVLSLLPRLRLTHPQLRVLVISMLNRPALIEALIQAGISGYILKDDYTSIQKLARIVERVGQGAIYFSPGATRQRPASLNQPLTARQLEALSLCTRYPDENTRALASRLGISASTLRNLLSACYQRLGVRTRAAAIARASQLGLLPGQPESNDT